MSTVVLIDLSSIAHALFAIHKDAADTNAPSRETVNRVRALAAGQEHVAICCDSGKSFRHQVDPTYKAQREARDPSLYHQLRIACERLEADGFPVWSQPGFEADDIIAAATGKATEQGHDVIICSADKDLLQLVGPHVKAKHPLTGEERDPEGVWVRFAVKPEQMGDYLCLVGDSSDNIKGAEGIGPKKAADLLGKFGTLDEVYQTLKETPATQRKALGFLPGIITALQEFAPRLEKVRELVSLRFDAPVPFDELFAPRVAKEVAEFNPEADFFPEAEDALPFDDGVEAMPEQETQQAIPEAVQEATAVVGTIGPERVPEGPTEPEKAPSAPVTAMVRTGEILQPWEQRLMPRDLREARIVAKDVYDSSMFASFGSPQAVLTAVMLGAEFGLPPMASLRGIHMIEGKPSMSAAMMAAVVMRSGLAEYFEPVEIGPESVTFETKRKGARNPLRVTHTIQMARQAWSKSEDAWNKSGWGRNPTDMLVARCQARLARYAYPDVLNNCYTPEEVAEFNEERRAS